MKTEFKIAWRYLFAKKQFNAIHIITAISSVAVGVVTAAMICVLSVMNGFGTMIEQMFSQFDPDIRITATVGKGQYLLLQHSLKARGQKCKRIALAAANARQKRYQLILLHNTISEEIFTQNGAEPPLS